MPTPYPDGQGKDRTEGHSLDAQRTEIKRYCEQQRYELVRIYADEGIAAHNAEISN